MPFNGRNRNLLNGLIGSFFPTPSPYGAASLEKTDKNRLAKSILEQFDHAGLKRPTLDLFPGPNELPSQRTPILHERRAEKYMKHEGEYTQGEINGVSNDGPLSESIRTFPQQGIFKGQKVCSSNALIHHWSAFRVFAVLHETAHDIADQLHLNEAVYQNIRRSDNALSLSGKDGFNVINDTMSNVHERIADASATLYTLSNYSGKTSNLEVLHAVRDWRLADAANSDHNTFTSIDTAIADFAKHPRQGLSLIETTKWAANIVAHQSNLLLEQKHSVTIQSRMAARSRFCTP